MSINYVLTSSESSFTARGISVYTCILYSGKVRSQCTLYWRHRGLKEKKDRKVAKELSSKLIRKSQSRINSLNTSVIKRLLANAEKTNINLSLIFCQLCAIQLNWFGTAFLWSLTRSSKTHAVNSLVNKEAHSTTN